MFCYYATFVFLLALPALRAAGPLPNFELIGSRSFYIEKNATLDWVDASRTCRRMGGELATIRGKEELNLIVPKLKWDSKYWLSLNDLEHEGTFVSGFSGQPASFLNWKQGQPDNFDLKEHCVFEINSYIYDSNCNDQNYFICEA